jgi:hypothetical protein
LKDERQLRPEIHMLFLSVAVKFTFEERRCSRSGCLSRAACIGCKDMDEVVLDSASQIATPAFVSTLSICIVFAPMFLLEVWKDTDKFVLNFSEPTREVGPITLVKGGKGQSSKAPQNLRYTSKDKLVRAKTLDDLW